MEAETGINASALRQSILKRAFEGGLVSQNAGDEPASELVDRIRPERKGKQSIPCRLGPEVATRDTS